MKVKEEDKGGSAGHILEKKAQQLLREKGTFFHIQGAYFFMLLLF